MRDALRGLTTRGRCFLAAAAAAAAAALVLGERDLLRVCVLLLALPLLAAAQVGRARYRLSCARSLEPQVVSAGTPARVVLTLRNLSAARTGTLLLEDRLPYALGSRPRLILEGLDGTLSSSVGYTVRADSRGSYAIGPLFVRITDAFGLCELVRGFPATTRLTVVPAVISLPSISLVGQHTGTETRDGHSVAIHGADDAAPREYREGDDLRRVHWRSTAKVGELMVRGEEQPWEASATVLLDTRLSAHRGEGPASSFEWAVSSAASIAAHLRHGGHRVRLVTTQVNLHQETAILTHLSDLRPTSRSTIPDLASRIGHARDSGVVIGIFGLLTSSEAEILASAKPRGTTGVVLLIDATTWTDVADGERRPPDLATESAASVLVRGGWRVIPVQRGMALPGLWQQAADASRGGNSR